MTGSSPNFEPVKFLRTHSKNKDNADVQTQVWSCAFEPKEGKRFYPGAVTVATCGGNSVCFIDCSSGTVIAKYYTKNQRICLFSLAWSSLLDVSERRNVLAVGGSESSFFLFDASQKLLVLEQQFKARKTVIINALTFHPTEKQILFTGSSDGVVRVCQIRKEAVAQSSQHRYSTEVNMVFQTDSEVYDMSYCLTTKFLFSSSDQGLNCFSFPTKEALIKPSHSKEGEGWIKTSIAGKSSGLFGIRRSGNDLVDSLRVLKDGLVACKYALHGCIYICNLNVLAAAHASRPGLKSFELEPLYTLAWSDTDNYFMYIGASTECGLLSCGDDRGALWLYDLTSLESRGRSLDPVPPTAILPWPTVTDHYNDKKRKLSLEVHDIVVDRVAVHSSGEYLVAVTNNNLVCLWRKVRL